jgi:hypothetical protein
MNNKIILKSACWSWVWWHMPIIPGVGKLRQEAYEFKASLNYIERPFLKKKKKK